MTSLRQNVEQTRQDFSKATCLPAACYTSESWFNDEREKIFDTTWLWCCHSSSLPQGGYVTRTLASKPVVVTRDEAGTVHAFLNSCRHRGCEVVSTDAVRDKMVCPLHGWTYSLAGNLTAAPGTGGIKSFDRTRYGLTRIQAVEVGGFVFVCFDRGVDAYEYFGSFIPDILQRYNTETRIPVHQETYELDTNWKLYVEVDQETLHTDFVHPASIGSQPVSIPSTSDNWVTVSHTADYSPALAPRHREHSLPPAPDLPVELTTVTYFSILLPGFFLITAPDVMWWINKHPISAGRTRVDVGYAFPPETLDSPTFEESYPMYKERLDQVIREDDWITEVQYRGIPGMVPGPYAKTETVVHRVDNWIVDRIYG